jgi:hypothetical protein
LLFVRSFVLWPLQTCMLCNGMAKFTRRCLPACWPVRVLVCRLTLPHRTAALTAANGSGGCIALCRLGLGHLYHPSDMPMPSCCFGDYLTVAKWLMNCTPDVAQAVGAHLAGSSADICAARLACRRWAADFSRTVAAVAVDACDTPGAWEAAAQAAATLFPSANCAVCNFARAPLATGVDLAALSCFTALRRARVRQPQASCSRRAHAIGRVASKVQGAASLHAWAVMCS